MLAEFPADVEAGLRVERGERLVEQQDLRRGGQGAGERDALGLTAGKLMRVSVREAGEVEAVQPVLRGPAGGGAFGATTA